LSPAPCELEIVTESATWSTTVICSREEILSLEQSALDLFRGRSSTLTPSFFLASLAGMAWTPRVVVVRDSVGIVGVVYAKERRIGGFRTGLVYADAILGGMVVSERGSEELVFRRGVSTLLTTPGIRGLRISVPQGGFETAAAHAIAVTLRTDISQTPLENHTVLPFPSLYSDFVDRLRSKTRRNFRYYRRRAEAAGLRYVQEMELSEFSRAAACLLEKSVTGADKDGITRALAMLSRVRAPLLAGLQTQNGEWVSILGGWCEGDQAILFFQMNDDRDRAADSLCVVLRGYLIEQLIARGIGSLLFWAGAGHPYSQYCHPVPAVALYLDRRGPLWRACRFLVRSAGPFLPRRFTWAADWIVPSPVPAPASNGPFPD
jgi:hypothetical protein